MSSKFGQTATIPATIESPVHKQSEVIGQTYTRDYQTRLAAETATYRDCADVHRLPPIFHYWSNRYLQPKLRLFGLQTPEDLFGQQLKDICCRAGSRPLRFLSIGSGNCDLEVQLAAGLRSQGYDHFLLDCLDLNEAMLARGREAAARAGVPEHLSFLVGDFNHWQPRHAYDSILVNQALHHVVNLEGLFASIQSALQPDGAFVISDMIGRNGHQRWPEALAIVNQFWCELPPSYRWNNQLRRYEELYQDWDCSSEGFEGIRAQDILPLLVKHFQFEFFFSFGNLIDPFIDRSFGHHFKLSEERDLAFIDKVQQRDEIELANGSIKPTHMLAVVSKGRGKPLICLEPLTPEFVLQSYTPPPPVTTPVRLDTLPGGDRAYRWEIPPCHLEDELRWAAQLLGALSLECERRKEWALNMERVAADTQAQVQILKGYINRPWRRLKLNGLQKRLRGLSSR